MYIGGRSPESFQGGKKPGLYSLGSSFPVNLRILCTGIFTEYSAYSRRTNRSKNKMRAIAIYYFGF